MQTVERAAGDAGVGGFGVADNARVVDFLVGQVYIFNLRVGKVDLSVTPVTRDFFPFDRSVIFRSLSCLRRL